jgi:hypothetical protein
MTSSRLLLVALALATAACADDQLPDAFFDNSVETFTIGSLHGTPVSMPSAYSIPENRVIRTDQSSAFDFAYVREGGRNLLVPLDAIGLGSRTGNPGIQHTNQGFEQLVNPPSDGYVTSDSVEVQVGDVLVARSRLCYLGVPQYAKLQVTSIDPDGGTLTFDVVANINCGYRSLALGIPRN